MGTVTVFESEAGFWTGSWKNVGIQVWGGEVTVARIERCGECNRAVLRAHPNRLVTLAIILPTANPRMGFAERDCVDRLAREHRGATLAAAQVVEGKGFWASTARAVLTGLNMLSSTRQKVFDADTEAVAWVVGERLIEATFLQVMDALTEARGLYTPERARTGRR